MTAAAIDPASDEARARAALVDTLRRMAALGLAPGTAGNVALRWGEGLLISPTGMAYESMRPEHIVRMAFDGRFEGEWLPSSEWQLHRDLLAARPELNAVVHTHSPNAMALAVLNRGIPAVHYMVATAGGPDIRCAGYATFGTVELSAEVARAMQGRRACLMAHHGALSAHATLDKALALALTVEEMAGIVLKLLPVVGGGQLPVLDDAEMMRVLEKFEHYGQPQRRAGG